MAFFVSLVPLVLLPSLASAYSFTFSDTPQQCQNLTIAITGTGKPPYNVVIIPFGPSPLPNNVEVRRIFSVAFDGDSTSASFMLNYPMNSQFVAVVSDSSAFGSGGTSVAATVQASNDSSCFNPTSQVSPDWYLNIAPANQIVECTATRIWWDASQVQGTPTFDGVIPGGDSFSIPVSTLSNVTGQGTGFNWTPSVRLGTTFLLVGSDDRGEGSGGSSFYIVSQGDSDSCLSSSSPSSTPGSPAGGSYPTSLSGSGTSGSSGTHTDVGAIVGGVIGGLIAAALIAIAFFLFRRRRNKHQTQKERPVDLLQDHDHDQEHDDGQLPQYYRPEPFMAAQPTMAGTEDDDSASESGTAPFRRRNRLSGATSASGLGYGVGLREPTPSGTQSMSSRKTPFPPSMRPVNIIQHDDAGESLHGGDDQEPETVELPPAYTQIRPSRAPSPAPADAPAVESES